MIPLALALGGWFAGAAHVAARADEWSGFPKRALAAAPSIDLDDADGPPSPIRPIADFCLLDEHRIAVLRTDGRLVLVTDEGVLLDEVALPHLRLSIGPLTVRLERFDRIVRTGPERVLLGPKLVWGDELAGLLEINLAAGRMCVPALIPKSEGGLDIAGSPDGGFALLIAPQRGQTRLCVYEQDGSLDWTRTKRVCCGADLCFTAEGRVAVLDAGQDAVQTFRWNGWWSSYERLEWPSEWTDGLQRIECAPDGQFWLSGFGSRTTNIVHGFPGKRPLRWSEVWHSDHSDVRGELRLSPGGSVWMSDRGACLCRIGPSGEVELVVGDAPQAHRLDEAQWISFDRDDHAFALAARDGALHEFDPQGRRLHVTPRPSGSEWHAQWDEPPAGFDEEHRLGLSWSKAARHADPQSEIASDGHGSFAFLRRPEEERAGEIRIVDASGAERARWSLPPLPSTYCDFDFDGQSVVLVLLDQVIAWRADGSPWFRATLAEPARTRDCGMEPSRLFKAHLARGGRELWLRRGGWNTTIERYALP
ncbi:MAG: hypothetical protein IPJ19_13615 [Planctomycetes bacterium]|nr:hypothetical protein [Planctomycetota bacterium]